MADIPVAKCRSCGAPIVWAVSQNNKSQPFDAVPTPEGKWRIHGRSAEPVDQLELGEPQLFYVPHPATCVDAAKWRRQ